MDMTNLNVGSDFWNRPEGKTAKYFILPAVIGVIGVALYKLLPFLITLMENMLYAGFLGGTILAIGWLLTSDWGRTRIFYVLQMISRALTSLFVNIDPVAILEAFSKDLKNKRKEVSGAITNMMGVRQKSMAARKTKVKEMDEAMRLADAAEQIGNEEKINEMAEKIARRQKAVEQLDENIAFADQTIEALNRIDRVIEYHINNSDDEKNELINNNELALKMIVATSAAKEVLGDSEKLDIRNMARDVILDRTAKAKGEVEHILQSTKSLQGEMDLNQLALRTEGRAKLAQLREAVQKAETGQGVKSLSSGAAKPIAGKASENVWAKRLQK